MITPLCTGAVTIAAELARPAAGQRTVEQRQHVGRIGGIQPAGDSWRAERQMENIAAGCGAARVFRVEIAESRLQAERCGALRRATAGRRERPAGIADVMARTGAGRVSGPIPAGSPLVTAMRGSISFLLESNLDVGTVAQLAQPVLVGFVELALAQRLARSRPLALFRDVRWRRSITWIRCMPNGDWTTGLSSPVLRASIARSNSGTVSPG